jgi:hypothetical protein
VLVASNAAAYQHFAWFSLDTNRNGTALIAGNINARTASVFSRSGGQWSETALLAPHPLARWFGIEVAFGGPGPDGDSVAIVGSRINDDKGRAYLFAHPGGVWRQIDYFTAPVEYYGYSVAASANAVFVGDRINSTGAPYAGAFHVHDIDPSCLAE